MKSSGIKQIWACLGCHIITKTWRLAHRNVIYALCAFISVLDTRVNQEGMAMTDDQESHSGNEVLMWRK